MLRRGDDVPVEVCHQRVAHLGVERLPRVLVDGAKGPRVSVRAPEAEADRLLPVPTAAADGRDAAVERREVELGHPEGGGPVVSPATAEQEPEEGARLVVRAWSDDDGVR